MITLLVVLALTAPAHPKEARVTDLKALQAKFPKQKLSREPFAFEHLKTPRTIYKVRVLRTKAPAYFMVDDKVQVLTSSAILPFLRAESAEAISEYFERLESGLVLSQNGNTRKISTFEGADKIVHEVTISVDDKGVMKRSVKVLERSPAEALPGDMMPMPE